MASKQKLSAKARKAKAIRDKKCAMTPDRKRKKAHSQRVRRAAIKKGKNIKGKDWDHKDGRFETIARNRANDGKGTKAEKGKNYKVPTRKA